MNTHMHFLLAVVATCAVCASPAHAGPQSSETTQTATLTGSPATNLAAGVRSTAEQSVNKSETTSGTSKTTQTFTAKNSPLTNVAAGVGAKATQSFNTAKQ